jgi:argininosuccinate lyase
LFKQKIIDSTTEIKNCLEIVDFTIKKIIVRKNILDDEKYKYVYSVENLNKLVNEGVSFRDAYMKISKEIKENTFKPHKEFNHTLKGSIGNLCLEEIKLKLKNVIDF